MSLPPPLPLAAAQERLLAAVSPLGAETVAVDRAVGRYLAEPLHARRSQPAADLSSMDGYALRGDDAGGPWTVVGESAAGHPFGEKLAQGEAIRISTGALMPAGDTLVLLQENAAREGDRLSLNGEGEPTVRHIRREGSDFRENDELLPADVCIGPAQLALAIVAGHATLPVHRRPKIAVLDSGDELSTDPAHCATHQLPASNGAMIAAMAAPWTDSVLRLGPVADSREALREALARTDGADVLVTSGGASVGDHDLVRPALEEWGARIDFWRVAMKPGKPLLVARRGRQCIVGLPGNPVSSYVTAFLLLLPLLRALGGDADPLPRRIGARLAQDLPATGNRREFRRGQFDGRGVTPLREQDSSALASLAAANALIDCPPDTPARSAGETVSLYPLDNGGIA